VCVEGSFGIKEGGDLALIFTPHDMTHRRHTMYEREVTIRGGFPLIVKFQVHPSEPDVGLFGPQIEIWEILTPRRQSAEFLNLTEAEEDDIIADLHSQLANEADDSLYW
jgi:hypothetical protein